MGMYLDALHTAHALFCKPPPLDQALWGRLIDILAPITAPHLKGGSVEPAILDEERRRFTKVRVKSWSRSSLATWVPADPARFERLTATFPSWASCVRAKATPGVLLKCARKPSTTEDRYDLVVLIVVKEAARESLREALPGLRQLLGEVVIELSTTRSWAIEVGPYQYTEHFQDLLPATLLRPGPGLERAADSQGWSVVG